MLAPAVALADLPQGWVNHPEAILALLARYRPVECVELGTWKGASAILVARVIAAWGGRLTCVDTWASGPFGPPVMLDECAANLERAGVANVTLVVGRSAEAGAQWTGRPVDYLYVDADHTDASVTADLEAWWPHVRVGGVLAGDDYGDPVYPGVTVAWDRFVAACGEVAQREGLIWIEKTRAHALRLRPYGERVMSGEVTTCRLCHRVVYARHLDGDGRCSACVPPPAPVSAPPSEAKETKRPSSLRIVPPAMDPVKE